MIDKYLPIGTVVLLKNGKKRVMITGFGCKGKDSDKMFDYSGCLYPEGILSLDNAYAFDHEQIEHIFFMGYVDEEEKAFKIKLKEAIVSLNNDSSANVPNNQ